MRSGAPQGPGCAGPGRPAARPPWRLRGASRDEIAPRVWPPAMAASREDGATPIADAVSRPFTTAPEVAARGLRRPHGARGSGRIARRGAGCAGSSARRRSSSGRPAIPAGRQHGDRARGRVARPQPLRYPTRSPSGSDHVWAARPGQGRCPGMADGRSWPCMRRPIRGSPGARPDGPPAVGVRSGARGLCRSGPNRVSRLPSRSPHIVPGGRPRRDAPHRLPASVRGPARSVRPDGPGSSRRFRSAPGPPAPCGWRARWQRPSRGFPAGAAARPRPAPAPAR